MFVLFLCKALMCSQSQAREVEEENSKLQLQVKELNEEYRARLVCYLQDLSVSCSTHTSMSTKYGNTTFTPEITFSFRSTLIHLEKVKALQRLLGWGHLWTACSRMFVHPTGSGRNSSPLLLAPIRRDFRRSPRPIMLSLLHTGETSCVLMCPFITCFSVNMPTP